MSRAWYIFPNTEVRCQVLLPQLELYMELIRASVAIADNPIDFSSVTLQQHLDWHHQVEIRINRRVTGGVLTELAEAYLGQPLIISLDKAPDASLLSNVFEVPPSFYGLVVGVEADYGSGDQQGIIIRGSSPTVLLDEGPNTRSFTDKDLKEVADEVLKDYKSKIAPLDETPSPRVEPSFPDVLPYLVQYKESNLEFLYRIAAKYGEWFYYNGLQLAFAPPSEEEPLELTYGEDLISFDITVKAVPAKFKLVAYDYLKHEYPNTEPKFADKLNPYAEIAHKKSKESLYPAAPLSPVIQAMQQKEVDHLGKMRQRFQVNEMVTLFGVSITPHLKIGGKIKITAPIDQEEENHGEYILKSLIHRVDQLGNYTNQFEAIPAELKTPPLNPRAHPPFCETQIAEVKQNDDDKGLGRIKVQFSWQQDTDETSPWIRVTSPFTGKDKGFYIIPEVGDQVLVDFEHHNPEKPYALGGFYHEKSKPEFSDKENNSKVIKTRSGNQILFSDKAGEETITISNPSSKNSITLSLGSTPTISIQSEGDISLSGKNIAINGTNIAITAEETLGVTGATVGIGDKAVILYGDEVTIDAEQAAKVASKGTVDVSSTQDTSVLAAQIKLNSP